MNIYEVKREITQIANMATLPFKNKKDLRDALELEIAVLVSKRSKHIRDLTRKSLRQHGYESDEEYLTRLSATIYGK